MTMDPTHRSMLILGCGYLGSRLARSAISAGWKVGALTRNPQTCGQLASIGVDPQICSGLNSNLWHEKLDTEDWSAVVNCVGSGSGSPEGYQSSYVEGMRSIMKWSTLSQPIQRFIYTSSASVYGDFGGAWVDEAGPTLPSSPQGEIILQSERIINGQSNSLHKWFILRLGGLYGPGRDSFLRNRTPDPEATSDPYLNLIHVDDACAAILRLADPLDSLPSAVYNLTDNHPTRRSVIDQWAQARIREIPQAMIEPGSAAKSMRSSAIRPNRRISSAALMADTGWAPKHRPPFAVESSD